MLLQKETLLLKTTATVKYKAYIEVLADSVKSGLEKKPTKSKRWSSKEPKMSLPVLAVLQFSP